MHVGEALHVRSSYFFREVFCHCKDAVYQVYVYTLEINVPILFVK